MREDLLGYLLSALEPHEMRRIEQQLCDNPSLQEELEFLQQSLGPLDQAVSQLPVIQTPSGLVASTLASLPPWPVGSELNDEAASATLGLAAMAPSNEGRRSRSASWTDVLVAGLASAAVLALLIPGIARERYEARRIACQDHLRQLGTAITEYVMLSRSESLPQIAESGPEAFAGMYAVRLDDSGLFPSAEVRWCPEVELAMPRTTEVDANEAIDKVVHMDDLRQASEPGRVDELRWLQQTAGGHYSYTLGVVDEGHYSAPRYEGRATFAVLGDSPIAGAEAAEGVDASKLRWGHRNSGANILFEDGSVRFLDMNNSHQFPDHPFFNHRGAIEAGVNIDDASVGPSWRAPFLSVRQR